MIHSRKDKKISLPRTLATAVELIINQDLQRALKSDLLNLEQLQKLWREIRRWSFESDKVFLNYMASDKINRLMQKFFENPEDIISLKRILETLKVLEKLPLNPDLWTVQNFYFFIDQKYTLRMKQSVNHPNALEWLKNFEELGTFLRMKKEENKNG